MHNLLLLLDSLWRWLRWVLRTLLALATLYLFTALLLGLLVHNRDWRPPEGGGVEIMLVSNGLHSGLALPVNAPGVDWRELFPPQHLKSRALQPNWDHVLLGWGERRFYLETPTWNDVRTSIALQALFGFGSGALHVEYLPALRPGVHAEPLTLSAEQYARLAQFVRDSLPRGPDGGALNIAGFYYSYNDAFYEARGSFSLFDTCNEWTRDALAAAGVRVPRWAPFDLALFWQLR